MKRYIVCSFIIVLFLVTGSCAVDSYTGSITVINNSDKLADKVTVGNYAVGSLPSGGTMTIYFKFMHESAKIDVDGFIPPPGYSGAIDLRLNYSYLVTLFKENGNYYFEAVAEAGGQDDEPKMK